ATGVDPATGLLARARERPGAAAVDWAVMAGEELPVAENAFDVVASCFAVIFAPDAPRAATGLRRAAAPGGRIGLTAWLPEGGIAEAGRIVMGALAVGRRPTAWFDPEVAAELLGGPVEVTRHTLTFTADSAETWLGEQEQYHPVWRMAVRALPADVWANARSETLSALQVHNDDPAAFRVASPYVVVIADTP
ncbi:MAG: class I SAM-dependent methyltransferase, partial [Actinomycetota bacterium]|nr:class I SAM-dependent methyltransferase [Actinomycetota bacterium]